MVLIGLWFSPGLSNGSEAPDVIIMGGPQMLLLGDGGFPSPHRPESHIVWRALKYLLYDALQAGFDALLFVWFYIEACGAGWGALLRWLVGGTFGALGSGVMWFCMLFKGGYLEVCKGAAAAWDAVTTMSSRYVSQKGEM